MKLPITTVVIIAILVLILVVVVVFFTSTAGSQISAVQADKIFTEQCLELCQKTKDGGVQFLMGLSEKNPQFLAACQVKYGTSVPNICISYCGKGCNIVATVQQELCDKSRAIAGSFAENCNRLVALPKYSDVKADCGKC